MNSGVSEQITQKSASNLALAFILLPPEKRAAMSALYAFCRQVDDAADEAAKYQREQSRALMNTALENIKKNGMSVTEFSPAEVAKFREKMKPVIAKHAATVGEATVNELMAELAKLRK